MIGQGMCTSPNRSMLQVFGLNPNFHTRACFPLLSLVFALQFSNNYVVIQSNDPKY